MNEQGIYSLNFDGLIKIIAVERISIQDPIQNLLQKNKNTFAQILASFGISGVVGVPQVLSREGLSQLLVLVLQLELLEGLLVLE